LISVEDQKNDYTGVRTIRRLVPQDGAVGESERRDRRQQVQGGELARQQLHEGEDGVALGADRVLRAI
jgi:hypothetical protein